MESSGNGNKGRGQGSKSGNNRNPEGPTPNLFWGQTKPRPSVPTKPHGRPPKPASTAKKSLEGSHKKKKKQHDSSFIENSHEDRSSRGKSKNTEKSKRDNRWTCSDCNTSNLSLRRCAICPACHLQRSEDAVTYLAASDKAESTVGMDNNSDYDSLLGHSVDPLSGLDDRGSICPPTPPISMSGSTISQRDYYQASDPYENTVNTAGLHQNGYYNNPNNPLPGYQTPSDNMQASPLAHNNNEYYAQPLDETEDTFDQGGYDYGDNSQGAHYDDY